MLRYLHIAICVLVCCASAMAQLHIPMDSPRAASEQRVGLTDIRVEYSRPAVKGRTIFGDVVPYGQIWRAGANENTVLTTSTPIFLDGKKLPAGRYGFHVIPTQTTWTVILSNQSHAWGSYFYDASQDALRFTVTPSVCANEELLTYDFPEATSTTATLRLRWATQQIAIKITINLEETVGASIIDQLTNLDGFSADKLLEGASYFRAHNFDKVRTKRWAERAAKSKPSYLALILVSDIAREEGNTQRADSLANKALAIATNEEINARGYQLLQLQQYPQAIELFERNAKQHPNDPNVWDSLGEGYATAGNSAKAIESFKKALSMNPPENVRANSEQWLQKLNKR